MNLSVEVSMYPLQDGYKPKIKDFLLYLNDQSTDGIEIRSSNMSTRLFGEYHQLCALLQDAMFHSTQTYGKIVFVCKYLEGDARDLKGYD